MEGSWEQTGFVGKTIGGVINIYFYWHLSSKETGAVMAVFLSLLALLSLAVAVVPQYSHVFPLYSVSLVRKVQNYIVKVQQFFKAENLSLNLNFNLLSESMSHLLLIILSETQIPSVK